MKKSIISLVVLTIVASMFSATAVFANTLPSDNLVAYWSFDEVKTLEDGTTKIVEDMTGKGYDMTILDTNYTVRNGISGKALTFAGTAANFTNGRMSTPAENLVNELNGSSAITITGYFLKASLGHGANDKVINFFTAPTSFELFATSASGNDEKLQLSTRSASGDKYTVKNVPVKFACANGWTNVVGWDEFAIVIDYANKKSYVYWNGDLAAENDMSHFKATNFSYAGAAEHMLYLCGGNTSAIDEIKIYNRAFTADEIKAATLPAIEYDFENACDGISDLSGNGANVTVTDVEAVSGVTGNAAKISTPATLKPSTFCGILRGAKAVTLSTWLKLDNGTLPTASETVLLDSYTSSNNSGFNLKITNQGKISAGGRTIQTNAHGGLQSNSNLFATSKDKWHHVAVVFDYANRTGYIYLDGKLDKTQEWTGTVMDQGFMNCGILAQTASNKDKLGNAGISMDSLKIYKRALSVNEIVNLASEIPFVTPEFSVTSSNVKVTMDIANQTGAEIVNGNATAILAVYGNERNELLKVKSLVLPTLKVGEKITESIDISELDINPAEVNVKLFIWDNIANMNSYTEVFTYPQ